MMIGLSKLSARLLAFRANASGNVALIAALLAMPTIGGAGYGLDYARAVSYRMKLDAAAHAAALGAIDAARALRLQYPNFTESEIISRARTRAQEIFDAQAPRSGVDGLSTNIALSMMGETASASAEYGASVPTTFVNVIGVAKLDIAGSAAANGPLTTPEEKAGYLLRELFDMVDASKGYVYINREYNRWTAGGAGVVEIGRAGDYDVSPPPTATQMLELDSSGNSSLSKKVFLAPGKYQLRYYFLNRVPVPVYDPVVVCGTTSDDLVWANAASEKLDPQTNAIGVYLDPAQSDTPPATFTLADNNMIDACVSSARRWIERSVEITIRTAGFYWLTFNGEGASDTYGGLVSDIRLCRTACPGAAASTFPWPAGTLLFRDDLEPPADQFTGQTIVSFRADVSGAMTPQSRWSSIAPGYTTTPMNNVEMARMAAFGVWTYVLALDTDGANSNRAVHRRFLLAPGVYRLDWTYSVGYDLDVFGTWCGLGSDSYATALAQVNALRPFYFKGDTNILGLYVDPDVLRLHPEHPPVLGATSTWLDWRGSSASSQQRLPVQRIDACVHSSTPSRRSSFFQIVRPGYYWITFRSEGTEDGWGPRIDNLRLFASSAQPDPQAFPPPPVVAPGTTLPGTVIYYPRGDIEVVKQN